MRSSIAKHVPMMKRFFLVFAIWIGAGSLASAQPESLHDQLVAFMTTSARAWNDGDLTTFMRGYEPAPTTIYISSKGVIRGYNAIRAHYASSYGTGMGRLSFSDVEVRPLGAGYAVIVARYHVAMKNGAQPTGLFSLILHRSPSGWHIIVDDSA